MSVRKIRVVFRSGESLSGENWNPQSRIVPIPPNWYKAEMSIKTANTTVLQSNPDIQTDRVMWGQVGLVGTL
jgi:hypothetical protein